MMKLQRIVLVTSCVLSLIACGPTENEEAKSKVDSLAKTKQIAKAKCESLQAEIDKHGRPGRDGLPQSLLDRIKAERPDGCALLGDAIRF